MEEEKLLHNDDPLLEVFRMVNIMDAGGISYDDFDHGDFIR